MKGSTLKRLFLTVTTTALLLALSVVPAHAAVLLNDNFDDRVASGVYTLNAPLSDGQTIGPWYVNFLGFGYGKVINASNSRLELSPADVDVTGQPTHAALVTTTASYSGNLEVEARVRLLQQLRNTGPNPWESPWLLWNVTTDANGVVLSANYFALKTNGWELGLITGNNGQVFLASGSTPIVSSTFKTVTIQQVGTTVSVWVAGKQVDLNGALTGKTIISSQLYTSGKVGLYTEDAIVQFDDVLVSSL